MDVHVRRAVTVALRLRGVDVLTAQEGDSAELDDAKLMDSATELRRLLVSQDDDLLREGAERLRKGQGFSGLIYAHQLRITVGQMVGDLELIATATSAQECGAESNIYRWCEPFVRRRDCSPQKTIGD